MLKCPVTMIGYEYKDKLRSFWPKFRFSGVAGLLIVSILTLSYYSDRNSADAANALVQSASNAHTYNNTATSIPLTLTATSTAGNLLVTAVAVDKYTSSITVPTGFTLIHDKIPASNGSISNSFAYKISDGTEKTITWTYATARVASAWVGEYSGLASSGVLDVSAENSSVEASVTSLSTGTTATTTQDNELAIAILAADSGTGVSGTRSWTNGFSEIAYVTQSSGSPGLSIASKTLTTTGTQETTFSAGTGDQYSAAIVTFKEASSDGVLSSTNIEPASLVLNAEGDVDVTFETSTALPSDGKINITFPTSLGSGFTFDSGGTTGVESISGLDGSLTVSTSSNVITLTRSAGTESSPGTKSFTLTNIKNPGVAGPTGAYGIETTSAGDVTIDEDASVTADTIVTGTITSANIEPASLVAGTTTSVTVSFTTATDLPSNGKIVLTFPTSLAGGFTFGVGGDTAVSSITGIDGTLSVATSSNVVTLTRSGGSEFAAGAISFVLSNVQNPPSSGSTGTYQIKTTTSVDSTLDEKTDVSADTITPAPASSWWNESWPYRNRITFDNSAQSEDLSNVPVMVSLSSDRIDYGLMDADGADIRFVDAGNSLALDYEIERWDVSGTSTIWVKVPQVAGASSTDHIFMYYGNGAIADGQDPAGVWDNGYVRVYHFGETSGNYYDSVTAYASSTASQTLSNRTSTLLGYAPTFGGSTSHFITISDDDAFNLATSTIEAFIQPAGSGSAITTGGGGLSSIYPIVTKGFAEADTSAADIHFFLGQNSAGTIGSDFEDSNVATNNAPISGSTSLSNGTSYYVASRVVPGTGGTHAVFLNGASNGSTALPVSGLNGVTPNTGGTMGVGIGTALNTGGTKNGGFNGIIDEVRFSSVARSADWLAFQNKSLFDTANTYGSTEVLGGAGVLSSTSVELDTYGIGDIVSATFDFTTANTLPSDGKIKITFPTSLGNGFTFDSSSSTTASSSGTIDGNLSVSIASNIVTITRSGGSAVSAGPLSISLDAIMNPNISGSSGSFSMQILDAADEVIDQASSISGVTITPGTISSADVEPVSLDSNASGSVGVSFTTENAIPANGKIVIVFPTTAGSFTFDSGGTTGVTAISGIDGSLSVATSSNTVTLTRSGGTSSASGAKSFNLTNIGNPTGSGSTGTYTIRTTNSTGGILDEKTDVSADTLIFTLSGSGTTIGFVSDGDDSSGTNVSTAMTVDINHLVTQLVSGWGIDAITWQGDIAYNGSDIPTAVLAWENSTASGAPLFFTPGNHDAETMADIAYLRSYFDNYPDYNLQRATEISYASTTNYSFEIGDVHVAVVNQYTNDTSDSDNSLSLGSGGGYIDNSVFTWLKQDLKNSTKTHNIVTGHEPAYPKSRHVGDSLDANPTNRNKLVNLLASYGVNAHIVGHTHKSKLEEMTYDYNLSASTTLGGGIWELDTGAFGTRAGGGGDDSYPTVGYFHANSSTWGDYAVRMVQGTGSPDWNSPTVISKSIADLDKQILVNTWTGAGTGTTTNGLFDMKYWVDYDSSVEANPDWSSNNSGRWWEPEFDADDASWSGGELAVGYDDNAAAWGWLNHQIDPDPNSSGTNKTFGYFGRVTFQATSTETYGNLDLDLDWEDALIVWLNGEVVFTSTTTEITVPSTGTGSEYFDQCTTDTGKNNNSGKQAATPVFTTNDISDDIDFLVNGTNTLAFMFSNSGTDCTDAKASSDAAVAIRLSMYGERTPPARDFDLIHYRWRNDDGNETNATFSASEDTATTSIPLGTKQRLRMEVSNEGDLSGSGTLTLQYGTSSDPTTGTWTTVPAYSSCGSSPICLEYSGLTHGGATTDVASGLTNESSSFVAGEQLETSSVSSSITLDDDEFTEVEYSIKVTGNADTGETYYFRLLRGASQLDSYSVVPQLTTINTSSGETVTFQQGISSYTGTTDTVIKTDFPTTNSGSDTSLEIDSTPDWGALVKWDISSIPSGVTVTSATMQFQVTDESGVAYDIYQLLRDWSESTATWNTTDGSTAWGTAGANNTSTDRSGTAVGELSLGDGLTGTETVTLNATGIQMVQDWIDGTDPNYGVTIQDYADAAGDGVDVDSSEGSTASTRPKLSVTYTATDSTAPYITDISSTVVDDTYGNDDVVDIDVTFSEPVTSTGSVTVTLNTGGTCTFAITDSAFGTCNYTIAEGDTETSDLSVSSISGTIEDGSANALVNFTPVVNLDDNREIAVSATPADSDAPVISSVSSSPSDSSVTITWTTDELASTKIQFGLTTTYASTTSETDTSPRVTSHSRAISGLTSCTQYNYRVISEDADSNTATGTNKTFTTTGCTGSATVDDIQTDSVTVSSGATVSLILGSRTFAVEVPADVTASSSSIIIQVKKVDSGEVIDTTGSPTGKTLLSDQIYDLQAYFDLDTNIDTFDEPITLTLSYASGDTSNVDESTLAIYFWTGSQWEELDDCVVDESANTVSCTTTHFSTFGVFGTTSSSPAVTSSRTIISTGTSGRYLANNANTNNTNIPGANNSTKNSYVFLKNLSQGQVDVDVLNLQKYLNSQKVFVSLSGAGSVGSETSYFGPATKSALINFQNIHSGEILAPAGLSYGTGYFGPSTRAFINSRAGSGSSNTAPSVPSQSIVTPPASNTTSSDAVSSGQENAGVTNTTTDVNTTFTKNLELGDIDEEVRTLQKTLNSLGFTIAESGPGSVGNETNIFGDATEAALVRFQKARGINPAIGYFGPVTRAEIVK